MVVNGRPFRQASAMSRVMRGGSLPRFLSDGCRCLFSCSQSASQGASGITADRPKREATWRSDVRDPMSQGLSIPSASHDNCPTSLTWSRGEVPHQPLTVKETIRGFRSNSITCRALVNCTCMSPSTTRPYSVMFRVEAKSMLGDKAMTCGVYGIKVGLDRGYMPTN